MNNSVRGNIILPAAPGRRDLLSGLEDSPSSVGGTTILPATNPHGKMYRDFANSLRPANEQIPEPVIREGAMLGGLKSLAPGQRDPFPYGGRRRSKKSKKSKARKSKKSRKSRKATRRRSA
jgi:hypothetical protein